MLKHIQPEKKPFRLAFWPLLFVVVLERSRQLNRHCPQAEATISRNNKTNYSSFLFVNQSSGELENVDLLRVYKCLTTILSFKVLAKGMFYSGMETEIHRLAMGQEFWIEACLMNESCFSSPLFVIVSCTELSSKKSHGCDDCPQSNICSYGNAQ